jgi:hypothetical protein
LTVIDRFLTGGGHLVRRPSPPGDQDNEKRNHMNTRPRITSFVVALVLAGGASPPLVEQTDLTTNGLEVPARSPSASNQTTAPTGPPTILRISSPSGFDWGDAGIGACGGFALSMIGIGGSLAVSERRGRRTHIAAARSRTAPASSIRESPPSGKGVPIATRST